MTQAQVNEKDGRADLTSTNTINCTEEVPVILDILARWIRHKISKGKGNWK